MIANKDESKKMLKTIVMLRAVNHMVNSPQEMKEISCIENRPYKFQIIFHSSVKYYIK